LSWEQYRQFWSQVVNWSLRKLENAELDAEVSVEDGDGVLSVEALDAQGEFRNFLDLQATVVSPSGEREQVALRQSGPGRYEARFPTREVGAYLVNLAELREGRPTGSMVVGASVNYSPEFAAESSSGQGVLRRLTQLSGGQMIDPTTLLPNPFLHDRIKTYQPRDLFELLLQLAVLLFPFDVALRRIDVDRADWARAWARVRCRLFFWQKQAGPLTQDESLSALLARRDQVRAARQGRPVNEVASELFQPVSTPVEHPVAAASSPAAVVAAQDKPGAAPSGGTGQSEVPPTTTASRLLEAKRRAQQRRK
jgi:Ca-activated chloride channel family protein